MKDGSETDQQCILIGTSRSLRMGVGGGLPLSSRLTPVGRREERGLRNNKYEE